MNSFDKNIRYKANFVGFKTAAQMSTLDKTLSGTRGNHDASSHFENVRRVATLIQSHV